MHPFQEQFDSVIRTIGLCEGCPAINQAQATIIELANKDENIFIPEDMSTEEYIEKTNTYLRTNVATVEDAHSERLLREFVVEIMAIQSLKRLIEQNGPCKGALSKDELGTLSFKTAEEERDFNDLLAAIREKYPHVFSKQNTSQAGYYCEVDNRRRTRFLDLFKSQDE
jgi:hypothetical protein